MARTLGLIAGGGRLPFEVAHAARERGLRLAIAAIENNTDPAIESLASAGVLWMAAGELQKLIDFLRGSGVDEVVFAGGVAKPEMLRDPTALRPDARAIALLGRLDRSGDDALLRGVAAEIEAEGLPVVESTRHLGECVAAERRLAGPEPDEQVRADLAHGLEVLRQIGAADIGQSVLVKRGAVLAVEAIEGTDAAIRRAAEHGGPGAVLVKCAKPGQDLRFDVPAIGPSTVEVAVAAGLAAIGLEAGRTIVLERERTLAAADEAGLTIVGLPGAGA